MSDNEMLLEISILLDKKLNARLKPIECELQDLKQHIDNLESSLKTEAKINQLRIEVGDIEKEIADIKSKLT